MASFETLVAEDCVKVYESLRLQKSYKYIIYCFNEDNTKIEVEKASSSDDYDDFQADLPEDECRWAVYDFEYEKTGAGQQVKRVFYSWLPEAAEVKDQMRYASGKDGIRKKLQGIDMEIQATDSVECSYETVSSKCS